MIFDIGDPVLLEHNERNVTVSAIAPKQSLLATGCDNGSIHLWELISCELVTSLIGPDDDVLPPGQTVPAAEGTSGGLSDKGQKSLVPIEERLGKVSGGAIGRGGGGDGEDDEDGGDGIVVNPPTRTILHITPKNRFTGAPNTTEASAAARRKAEEMPKPVYTATDRSGMRAMAAQQKLLEADKRRAVRSLGDAPTTTRVKNLKLFHSGMAVNGLSFGGDGSVLASCGEDGSFYIFDISNIAPKVTTDERFSQSMAAAVNPDGSKASKREELQALARRRAAMRSGQPQAIKWRRLAGHNGSPLLKCVFSPHSLLLATCGKDNDIMLWGTLGRPVCGRLSGHTNWVSCVAFSHDSNYLVSGSHDHTMSLWNCRTFQQIRTTRVHNTAVLCVCFTVENTVIASGDDDGYIMLTRTSDGSCLRSVRGHFDSVTGITFVESLGCFLTVSHDSSLRVWSLRAECNETFKAHKGRIHSLSISLHDELIVTTGGDGKAAVMPFTLKEEDEDY